MDKGHKVERTARQKAALRYAYKRLTAQFDHVLIVCSLDSDKHEDAVSRDLPVYWKGGWLEAGVMIEFAKRRIEYSQRNTLAPH